MKHLSIILLSLFCTLTTTVRAQYYSVNYDKETVAAMSAAYASGAVAEGYYNKQVQEILKHYGVAELASARNLRFEVFGTQGVDRPWGVVFLNGELLLPPYLRYGGEQDYAKDMDGGWHDAQ